MIRTRPRHWERRTWRYWIGWVVAGLIPAVVAVVVALTGLEGDSVR